MRWYALAAALCAVVFMRPAAWADGMMVPRREDWNRYRERAYINEPEQAAAVFFRQGQEDLVISPGSETVASEFAWVVPVPSRPKVRIVEGALFHELARLAFPEPPRDAAKSLRGGMGAPGAAAVRVLERRTVGAYYVTVLEATDGRALMKWLDANRYYLPEKAIGPVRAYVREKWTFVACRIRAPRAEAEGAQPPARRLRTLAPLRLTFAARQPVYPIRLSAANPRPFSVLLYLVLPESEAGGSPATIPVASAPGERGRHAARWRASIPAGQTFYPTLAKFGDGPMRVYVQDGRYLAPEECTRDYVWRLTASSSARARAR